MIASRAKLLLSGNETVYANDSICHRRPGAILAIDPGSVIDLWWSFSAILASQQPFSFYFPDFGEFANIRLAT